jgi:glycosyltransferase involved in cell wall biosynthesis
MMISLNPNQTPSEATAETRAIFCSAIIPTVGRSTLARAVESVLNQELLHADYEVLVINDSGSPLPAEDWQKSPRVQVIDTNRRERSVARNTGAALARGQYLHFLDDDDFLAPCAYQNLLELSRDSSASWLYGMTQLLDRENNPTIQLRHNLRGNCFLQAMAGEWIPLQASLIEKKTFMRIGGFNPTLTGPEDIDLLRRIVLEETVDETPNIVAYVIIGEVGSTTNYNNHSEASRSARETVLNASQVFQRMLSSAGSSYWFGRLVRIYLTSVVWNLKHGHFTRAASRSAFAFAGILAAGRRILFSDFWRAVLKSYASHTFEAGIVQARGDQ